MKLPDFTLHAGFNELRRLMEADLIERVQEDPEWQRLIIQLEQEGIGDVSFDEIEIQSDSTFEYRGQKVIVYIRDQRAHVLDRGDEYKFHVAQCDTLDRMHSNKKGSRYVVTTRKDGKFVVNITNGAKVVVAKKESQMKICKNCISTLMLGAFKQTMMPVTPDNFSIAEFFSKYSSRITRMPKHTEKTAPLNIYTDDWRNKANQLKEENGWQCEECCESFSGQKELLHAHHIDGDKSNNHNHNLRALCVVCHAEQPGHEQMKATPAYKRLKATRNYKRPKATPDYKRLAELGIHTLMVAEADQSKEEVKTPEQLMTAERRAESYIPW